MSMTVPTAEGQGLGGFLEELRAAARVALLAPLSPQFAAQAWVRLEEDTVTGSDFVAELCGVEAADVYFRITYERGPDGRIVLGEPVRVEEKTTYEPAAVALSAVLCEIAPVHAPAAEGLLRGRTAQLMRVGPLHDAYTGEELLTVTDEMLAAMVAAALLSRHTGGAAWYGLGAVVATSRIHVRIHHASDVAGGIVIGAALGALARRIVG